jgi:hypothetical protein
MGLSETLSSPSAFCVILSAMKPSYGDSRSPSFGDNAP